MSENKKIYLLRFLTVFLIFLCLFEFIEFVIRTDAEIEIYNNIKFFSKTNMWQLVQILHTFVLMFAELTGANFCLKSCRTISTSESDKDAYALKLKADFAFLLAYWAIIVVAFLVFMCIQQIPFMFKIDFSIIFIFLFIFGLYKLLEYRFEKRHERRHR